MCENVTVNVNENVNENVSLSVSASIANLRPTTPVPGRQLTIFLFILLNSDWQRDLIAWTKEPIK